MHFTSYCLKEKENIASCHKSKQRKVYSIHSLHFFSNHQCYYVGGTEDAATSILNSVLKPLSYHKPAEKICEDLKRKDSQICALQYGKIQCKEIDFPSLFSYCFLYFE